MKSVVKTGKSVDEAVQLALQELGASLDDVKIEVMEQAKSGLFGFFGAKDAVVRVELKNQGLKEELRREVQGQAEAVETKKEEPEAKPVQEKAKWEDAKVEAREEKPSQEASSEEVSSKEASSTEVSSTEVSLADAPASPVMEPSQEETGEEAPKAVGEETPKSAGEEAPKAAGEEAPSLGSLSDLIHQEVEKSKEKDRSLAGEDSQAKGAALSSPALSKELSEEATEEVEEEELLLKEETSATFLEEEEEGASRNLEERRAFALQWLEEVIGQMHIEASFTSEFRASDLYIELVDISDTDAGIVIGRRAETLNALQYLLGISMNRHFHSKGRVYLDVGGYRERREQNIQRLAKRSADKVLKYHRSIKLEPMSAYERRIVHTYLQSYDEIETVSEGREPYRKVVILYKEK